jgi:hypothetical protein
LARWWWCVVCGGVSHTFNLPWWGVI